jgi:hypothetical protein
LSNIIGILNRLVTNNKSVTQSHCITASGLTLACKK